VRNAFIGLVFRSQSKFTLPHMPLSVLSNSIIKYLLLYEHSYIIANWFKCGSVDCYSFESSHFFYV